jgi:hypothetical protein
MSVAERSGEADRSWRAAGLKRIAKNLAHRDEVERLSSTSVSAQHPVVIAARFWNRCSPFALASSIPQGTAPFRQA